MKTINIYLLSLLCSIILSSCSGLSTPEETVKTYLTTIMKEYEKKEYFESKEILTMYCNERKPITEDDGADYNTVINNICVRHNAKSFEIIATGFSENREAALVQVAINRQDDNYVIETIFLSKVENKWLIDLFTKDNTEFYQANNNLKEILENRENKESKANDGEPKMKEEKPIAKEEPKAKEEEPKANGGENFDSFIKKFATNYEFQLSRINFPVGYEVLISEDGSEEKIKLTKNKWNKNKFSDFMTTYFSPKKDNDEKYTYSWDSDGGAAGGTAIFTLKNNKWYLTDYSSFSL